MALLLCLEFLEILITLINNNTRVCWLFNILVLRSRVIAYIILRRIALIMGRVIRGKYTPHPHSNEHHPDNAFTTYSPKTWSFHHLQGPHLEESRPRPFQNPRLRRESRVSIGNHIKHEAISRFSISARLLTRSFCLATSRVSLRTSFTTPAVAPLSPKLFSETSTNTSNALSISSLSRASTPVSLSTLAPKVSDPLTF